MTYFSPLDVFQLKEIQFAIAILLINLALEELLTCTNIELLGEVVRVFGNLTREARVRQLIAERHRMIVRDSFIIAVNFQSIFANYSFSLSHLFSSF